MCDSWVMVLKTYFGDVRPVTFAELKELTAEDRAELLDGIRKLTEQASEQAA